MTSFRIERFYIPYRRSTRQRRLFSSAAAGKALPLPSVLRACGGPSPEVAAQGLQQGLQGPHQAGVLAVDREAGTGQDLGSRFRELGPLLHRQRLEPGSREARRGRNSRSTSASAFSFHIRLLQGRGQLLQAESWRRFRTGASASRASRSAAFFSSSFWTLHLPAGAIRLQGLQGSCAFPAPWSGAGAPPR